jgi:hypothetical protein
LARDPLTRISLGPGNGVAGAAAAGLLQSSAGRIAVGATRAHPKLREPTAPAKRAHLLTGRRGHPRPQTAVPTAHVRLNVSRAVVNMQDRQSRSRSAVGHALRLSLHRLSRSRQRLVAVRLTHGPTNSHGRHGAAAQRSVRPRPAKAQSPHGRRRRSKRVMIGSGLPKTFRPSCASLRGPSRCQAGANGASRLRLAHAASRDAGAPPWGRLRPTLQAIGIKLRSCQRIGRRGRSAKLRRRNTRMIPREACFSDPQARARPVLMVRG